MSPLTKSEQRFLESQEYPSDRVYDARGQRGADWKAAAKQADADVVIGSPCAKAGHRLRTRAGHCIQCDTRKLGYQLRHGATAHVYVAGSLEARLIKVGLAKDIDQRQRNLRHHAYGGFTDWAMLFHVYVERAGEVEKAVQTSLRPWRVALAYEKDGLVQMGGEMFAVSCSQAIAALITIARGGRSWRARDVAQYEFEQEPA